VAVRRGRGDLGGHRLAPASFNPRPTPMSAQPGPDDRRRSRRGLTGNARFRVATRKRDSRFPI
jgi:hypothetical protein